MTQIWTTSSFAWPEFRLLVSASLAAGAPETLLRDAKAVVVATVDNISVDPAGAGPEDNRRFCELTLTDVVLDRFNLLSANPPEIEIEVEPFTRSGPFDRHSSAASRAGIHALLFLDHPGDKWILIHTPFAMYELQRDSAFVSVHCPCDSKLTPVRQTTLEDLIHACGP